MKDYKITFDSGVIITFHNRKSLADVIVDEVLMLPDNIGEITKITIRKKSK